MPKIDEIKRSFSDHAPKLIDERPGLRRAGVAMVLREREGRPEVLFIERALHEKDPWSGHMAFPGGRMDPTDASVQGAAERETLEEVGISLVGAETVGRLDDLQGRHAGRTNSLVISGFVFHHPEPDDLVPNEEVRHSFWFPLSELLEPERHVERQFRETGNMTFPGVVVGHPERHVVWGLTYRFLEVFFETVGRPLRDPR